MLDVAEAQRILFQCVLPGAKRRVALAHALGRTLAESFLCDVDDPPFSRSQMDGFAIRATDVVGAPTRLRVVGLVPAGSMFDRALAEGEAVQISTGAPLPAGADSVVRVEDTEQAADGRTVLIRVRVSSGQFVIDRGAYVSTGQEVLSVGARLGPLEIAAAATAGAAEVVVYDRPRVGILTTGNELIEVHDKPRGAQIRNSNAYLLNALALSAAAEPVSLGVARDDPEEIREKLTKGLACDVVCVTGGASVGEFDFVPQVFSEIGATIHVHKMMIKPGRPTLFATAPGGTLLFGLPGNPISTFVAFELLVRPALAAREGRRGAIPREVSALLRGSIKATENRRSYWPARTRVLDNGQWEAEALSWQGSGDPFGIVGANALVVRPPGSVGVATGEWVKILLLEHR